MDASPGVISAGPPSDLCPACGAPVEVGQVTTCGECGLPLAVAGAPAVVAAASRPDPAAPPAPLPPDPGLRVPGPNQWYSERFRAAVADPGTSAGVTQGPLARPVVGLFSDLPFRAPPMAVGWLVVVGAWLSALAFLVPWANAAGLGYFDAWGLYKTSHLLVFFAAVAIALVAILPLRLPDLLRLALLPLLLGAFEFGLVWEWLGGQAVGLGVWLLLIGAVLCVSGGVVVASRLVEPGRPT